MAKLPPPRPTSSTPTSTARTSGRRGAKPESKTSEKAPVGFAEEPAAPKVDPATSTRLSDAVADFGDDELADAVDPAVTATPRPAPAPTVSIPAGEQPDTPEANRKRSSKRKPETIAEKRARLEREAAETPEQRQARITAELAELNGKSGKGGRGASSTEPLRSSYLNRVNSRATAMQKAYDALATPEVLDATIASSLRTSLLAERDAIIRKWMKLNQQRIDQNYEETDALRPLQFVADGATFKYNPTPRGKKGDE